jgi:hypothetical protein
MNVKSLTHTLIWEGWPLCASILMHTIIIVLLALELGMMSIGPRERSWSDIFPLISFISYLHLMISAVPVDFWPYEGLEQ